MFLDVVHAITFLFLMAILNIKAPNTVGTYFPVQFSLEIIN